MSREKAPSSLGGSDRRPRRPWRIRRALPFGVLVAFLIQALAVVGLSILLYQSIHERAEHAAQTRLSTARLAQVAQVLSKLTDAETGQRGYLLTGEDRYLEPFRTADLELPDALADLRALVRDAPTQAERVDRLAEITHQKLEELRSTIAMVAAGQRERALAIVRTDRGKILMDRARKLMAELAGAERDRLENSAQMRVGSVGVASLLTWGGMGLILFLMGVSAYAAGRSFRNRDIETWIRMGQTDLSSRLSGDGNMVASELADRAIRFLAEYLDAQIGALYVLQADKSYRRLASFAVPPAASSETVTIEDGLVGECVRERRIIEVSDVPGDYFAVTPGLGARKPRHLVVAPGRVNGEVTAAIELGFFRRTGAAEIQLLERVSETIAGALRAAAYRARQAELLDESQRQAAELQESQLQLETNHRELEQANAQLEEQTQALESQKDGLVATGLMLEQQAAQLERTSRYKSEFLANMSHELRTPLNSLLILGKLLADNNEGNLTPDQVRYAESIGSAGTDLLTLINDILDLSKIEAGKIDLELEKVAVSRLVEDIQRRFEPLAADRGLELMVALEASCPETIATDRQRLQQILTNLVANAVKFTEKGHIRLSIARRDEQHVAFVVEDTGCGIAPEHHEVIFEAFRQADAARNRKFGGTGLGLSISRQLARSLGGEIELQSAPGAGSTFTLILPLIPREAQAAASPVVSPAPAAGDTNPVPEPPPVADGERPARTMRRALVIEDDDTQRMVRDRETALEGRRILVVEDDARNIFALCSLLEPKGAQVEIARNGKEAIARLERQPPIGLVLMDLMMPEMDGLAAIHEIRTRDVHRDLPILALTSKAMPDDRLACLEAGANDYIAKPIEVDKLLSLLRAWMPRDAVR